MSESIVFEISSTEDPRKLTQSVIQIIDCLGMYQAELARVLTLQCGDIGQLSSARSCLVPDTVAWNQALLFVRMYQALYKRFDGDSVAMIHWLRADNIKLKQSPHLLIVDDNNLTGVVDYLENIIENDIE